MGWAAGNVRGTQCIAGTWDMITWYRAYWGYLKCHCMVRGVRWHMRHCDMMQGVKGWEKFGSCWMHFPTSYSCSSYLCASGQDSDHMFTCSHSATSLVKILDQGEWLGDRLYLQERSVCRNTSSGRTPLMLESRRGRVHLNWCEHLLPHSFLEHNTGHRLILNPLHAIRGIGVIEVYTDFIKD